MYHDSNKARASKFAETLGVVWVGFALILGIVIVVLPNNGSVEKNNEPQEPQLKQTETLKEVRFKPKTSATTLVNIKGPDGTSASENTEAVKTKAVIE